MFKIITAWRKSLESANPWTPILGFARSLIALSTLLTLLVNNTDILFTLGTGIEKIPICSGSAEVSLFCLLSTKLELARWLAIVILVFTISGFYPQVSGVLHCWVSFSLFNSSVNVDGGDQVSTVLCLLMLPALITDPRKNHWTLDKAIDQSSFKVLAARSSLLAVQIQVSFLYLDATVSKFNVNEWLNGTALYYWINNPLIGPSSRVQSLLNFAFRSDVLLCLTTWSVLLFELLLFLSIFFPRRLRIRIFLPALCFHLLTAIFFGIITFFFAMAGALFLYLLTPRYKFVTDVLPKTAGTLSLIFLLPAFL